MIFSHNFSFNFIHAQKGFIWHEMSNEQRKFHFTITRADPLLSCLY